jgi:hypothetical protein
MFFLSISDKANIEDNAPINWSLPDTVVYDLNSFSAVQEYINLKNSTTTTMAKKTNSISGPALTIRHDHLFPINHQIQKRNDNIIQMEDSSLESTLGTISFLDDKVNLNKTR